MGAARRDNVVGLAMRKSVIMSSSDCTYVLKILRRALESSITGHFLQVSPEQSAHPTGFTKNETAKRASRCLGEMETLHESRRLN